MAVDISMKAIIIFTSPGSADPRLFLYGKRNILARDMLMEEIRD